MGEVYRARDTRLDRQVAIKVLPSALAASGSLRQRFEREARAVSQLAHPHICTLFDIGHDGGTDYLVMEYLEGETLAKRLERGPLSLGEILEYGTQIADALGAAHRQGIVHRDLKPGNIMITRAGAKLLDFGLAKLAERTVSAPVGLTTGATEQKQLTQEGTILGTFQYMAPEQLAGEGADMRSDIFALGAVLYEMTTGRRAFEGKNKTSLVAAIIGAAPRPIGEMQPLTPPALEHVILQCLEKEPDDRWQSASDVALELQWIAATGTAAASKPVQRRTSFVWLAAIVIAALVGATAAWMLRPPAAAGPLHVDLVAPPDVRLAGFEMGGSAISPEGERIVFAGTDTEGARRLFLRDLRDGHVRVVTGTEGAQFPFWSPDGTAIAFFSEGRLKKTMVDGAGPFVIAESADGRGGSWSTQGTIAFAPSSTAGIALVAASGGSVSAATRLTAGQSSHRFPSFLPDGKHFLYFASGAREERGIYIASVDGRTNRRLRDESSNAVYMPPGYAVFARGDAVMAQRLSHRTLTLTGEPRQIGRAVSASLPFGASGISASHTGSIAYHSGAEGGNEAVERDRSGQRLRLIGSERVYSEPDLTYDETRLVAVIDEDESGEVWMFDTARARASRLTFDGLRKHAPICTPDGSVIYTVSGQKTEVRKQSLTTGAAAELLLVADVPLYTDDLSPDGKYLLLDTAGDKATFDVLVLSLADKKLRPLLSSNFNEVRASFSPDGKYIAYTSDETGRAEVFVQTFPPTGAKWQVSSRGGDQAQWRGDGRELFYLAPDRRLMSVEIEQSPALTFSEPAPLFAVPFEQVSITGNRNQYVVTRDGQKFILLEPSSSGRGAHLSVVHNARAMLDP